MGVFSTLVIKVSTLQSVLAQTINSSWCNMIHEMEDDSLCSWNVFAFLEKMFLIFVKLRDEIHVGNVLAELWCWFFCITTFTESDF